jgi:hypothetical protein
MSTSSPTPLLTLDALTSGALAPWFKGSGVAAGDKVATPRDAAAAAVLAALNSPEGSKGKIRILVTNIEDRRLTKNFLDAFLSDVPALKRMVRKVSQDGSVLLHGGVTIVIDMNEARLAKDSIATIILDAAANEAIGTVWWDQDETREECAVRCGYRPDQAPDLRFIRWLRPGEGPVQQCIEPTPDGRIEAGPPADDQVVVNEVADPADMAAAEAKWLKAKEVLAREAQNERLAEGYARMGKY